MRSHTPHGGRHELGQNFLHHRPTIERIVALVGATDGPILEIGSGDGALTRPLAGLGRDLIAVDLDRRRVERLRARLPGVTVRQGDALDVPLDRPVVVGNVPFHLTTPILRRLLRSPGWRHAVLVTQWEVARKRSGVGGSTMMTAQSAPWFAFDLHHRVPASHFTPMPSVDGGILTVERREHPLVPTTERARYERFVRAVFTGRGRGLEQILVRVTGTPARGVRRALAEAPVGRAALPRDLAPAQWAALWCRLGAAAVNERSPGS
ncbi:23S ribosomal RNA methyltransferase Erm [Mumia sp. zg.B17]|uniref:23S ribosomal RNA methyltransferase Erm n=1 Tax=Mumia sp. zg.B17 TaxID=2855446 RepID=UPI001C6DD63E|nr:23S ribosomal RNA methyltransferase Erm [Mumia sp. zg.B17]MBW9205808.1 23S ribosomal RNA methyltransferase Erm [Mumia sp. zg.B17]